MFKWQVHKKRKYAGANRVLTTTAALAAEGTNAFGPAVRLALVCPDPPPRRCAAVSASLCQLPGLLCASVFSDDLLVLSGRTPRPARSQRRVSRRRNSLANGDPSRALAEPTHEADCCSAPSKLGLQGVRAGDQRQAVHAFEQGADDASAQDPSRLLPSKLAAASSGCRVWN